MSFRLLDSFLFFNFKYRDRIAAGVVSLLVVLGKVVRLQINVRKVRNALLVDAYMSGAL